MTIILESADVEGTQQILFVFKQMNKPLKDRGLSTAFLNSYTEPMCAIKLATAAIWNYEVKENILLFIKAGV